MEENRPPLADGCEPERRLARSIEALRIETRVGLPTLHETAQALKSSVRRSAGAAQQPKASEGGLFMKMLRPLSSRPRFVGTLAGLTLAAGVLFLPVSYEKVVGHVVTLHLPAQKRSPDELRRLARSARTALVAQSVKVEAVANAGEARIDIIASLPETSAKAVDRRKQALVQALQASGYAVTADVTARTEKTAGRVYAMALDKLIRIHVDTAGKTDAQVEDALRAELEKNGIRSPAVSYERHGDETQLQVSASADGRRLELRQHKKGGADGGIQLEFGGIDDTRDPGMTDDELREKILRQLRARGLDATVTVSGDRIEIRMHRPDPAP
jgi:hypothetical protein